MKPLFEVDESYHGRGPVIFKWQNDGNYLATTGSNGLLVSYLCYNFVGDNDFFGC